MTKTEQYNNEVVKIYKNPLLNVDEAINEYLNFRNTQKFLKKPKDKVSSFILYKLTEDYIEIVSKMILNFVKDYPDVENFMLKNKTVYTDKSTGLSVEITLNKEQK